MSLRKRLLFCAVQTVFAAATVPASAGVKPEHPRFADRFNAANTTHDGHLTLAQAQAAHMGGVARQFAAIDSQGKGYVTIDDVRAYHRQQAAAKAAASTGVTP